MHIQFNAYPIQCIWEGMKKQEPIIKHSDRAIELVRTGRGYSMAKLDEVGGLRDIRFSRNHGIRVDPLRKTSYRENVQQLGAKRQLSTPENLKLKRAVIRKGPTSNKAYPALRIESPQRLRNDYTNLCY
jgi:ribosomal protein L13E